MHSVDAFAIFITFHLLIDGTDPVAASNVRSLSGTKATTGNQTTNENVLQLITTGLLGGYAVRKIKQFNDRIYLSRFRRSYWLGVRYFHLDNNYYLSTRDTCIYEMNEGERDGLEYEDGIPIYNVVYQCQRFVEYCCGLDCCADQASIDKMRDQRDFPNFFANDIPFQCPNSEHPERESNGDVKQCLPGHNDECSSGYTCFFFGSNYQCCPSKDAEIGKHEAAAECPSPTITILNDNGNPLKCTPGTHECPKHTMECTNVGEQWLCCESLSNKPQTVHTLEPIDLIDSTVTLSKNLDCPEPSFTILDADGEPLPCDSDECNSQPGRFCYKELSRPICCEAEDKAVDEDELIKRLLSETKRRNKNTWNPLRYTPFNQQLSVPKHRSPFAFAPGRKQIKYERFYIDGSTQSNQTIISSQQVSPLVNGPRQSGQGAASQFEADDQSKMFRTDSEGRFSAGASKKGTLDSSANNFDTHQLATPSDTALTLNEDSSTILTDLMEDKPKIASASTSSTIAPSSMATANTPLEATTSVAISTLQTTTVTSSSKALQSERLQNRSENIDHQPAVLEALKKVNQTIRYKPHSAGGYAVSKAFAVKTQKETDEEQKIARQYLLEQIRHGWPYSEQYYVPRNVRADPQRFEISFDDESQS